MYGARFSRPNPNLIFAGGAGRNEVKIFENNIDSSASMRIMSIINEFDSPCLSLDASNNGESFAFGLQDGRVYVVNYKIDDLVGDFEGYQGQFSLSKAKEFIEEKEKEHQHHQQLLSAHIHGHIGHSDRNSTGHTSGTNLQGAS